VLGLVLSVIVVAGIIAVITEMVVNDGTQPATLRRLWDRGSVAVGSLAARWKQARAARADRPRHAARPAETAAAVPAVSRPDATLRPAPARVATVAPPRPRHRDAAPESAVITPARRIRSGVSLLALVAVLGAATAVTVGVTILLAGVAIRHLVG
jgi:hypothetical protein